MGMDPTKTQKKLTIVSVFIFEKSSGEWDRVSSIDFAKRFSLRIGEIYDYLKNRFSGLTEPPQLSEQLHGPIESCWWAQIEIPIGGK